MKRYLTLLALGLLLCAPLTSWSKPTLSVLYFQDSAPTEQSAAFSKALAEILIADLASCADIQLVEREQLNKVMSEIALGQSGAVEQSSAVEAGRLLGASFLLTGSYFIDNHAMTVTLKFLSAASGAVVAADKVQGSTRDFSDLMDKLVEASLKLIPRLSPSSQSAVAFKHELTYASTVLFGQALAVIDKGDLQASATLLDTLISQAPAFSYARITRESVSARLSQLSALHNRSIEATKTQPVTFMGFTQVATDHLSAMRYEELMSYCTKVRPSPPQAPEGSMVSGSELVEYFALSAANSLRQWQYVVEEGSRFLASYPGSMYFSSIRMMVKMATAEYEKQKAAEATIPASLSAWEAQAMKAEEPEASALNYRIGAAYVEKGLHERAHGFMAKVDAHAAAQQLTELTTDLILFNLFMCFYHNVDKERGRNIYRLMAEQYGASPYFEGVNTIWTFWGD